LSQTEEEGEKEKRVGPEGQENSRVGEKGLQVAIRVTHDGNFFSVNSLVGRCTEERLTGVGKGKSGETGKKKRRKYETSFSLLD